MACTIDFRRLDEGFGGKTYKRKRNPQAYDEDASVFGGAAMEIDDSYPPPAKRSAVPSSGPASGSRATTASSREKSPGGSGSSQGSRGRRRRKLAERGRRSRRGQRRRR
ncbi:hypothetical protein ACFXTN_032120 [Malus domestica]